MATELTLHCAGEADLIELLRTMDEDDREEMRQLGVDPVDVHYLVVHAGGATAARVNGELAALFGVLPTEQGVAPWMLTTPVVRRHPLMLVRVGRRVVRAWGRRYGTLTNYCWDGHVRARRLIEALGGSVQDASPAPGRPGVLCRRFYFSQEVAAC